MQIWMSLSWTLEHVIQATLYKVQPRICNRRLVSIVRGTVNSCVSCDCRVVSPVIYSRDTVNYCVSCVNTVETLCIFCVHYDSTVVSIMIVQCVMLREYVLIVIYHSNLCTTLVLTRYIIIRKIFIVLTPCFVFVTPHPAL